MGEKKAADEPGGRRCDGKDAGAGRREKAHSQKHPCPDCSFCQWCGDDRCRLCRGCRPAAGRKLSLAEQIALFERVNSHKPADAEESGSATADGEVP